NLNLTTATLEMARLFARAHLPTLASLYQEYARSELGAADAYGDLCETLLDIGAVDFVPPAEPADALFDEYVRNRALAASGHALQAKSMLQVGAKLGRVADRTARGGRGLVLLEAELTVMFGGEAAALADVQQISDAHPHWRFAHRVRARLAARQCEKGVD